MAYEITLEDDSTTWTSPAPNTPLTEQVIEATSEVVTLDLNIYVDLFNTKRVWTIRWGYMDASDYASRINGNGGSGQATPDIIPVTNAKEQPTTQISVNVSGVLATSEQDKRKLAEMIAKQLEGQLRAKGLKGAF